MLRRAAVTRRHGASRSKWRRLLFALQLRRIVQLRLRLSPEN
jgi:hypothetical protein